MMKNIDKAAVNVYQIVQQQPLQSFIKVSFFAAMNRRVHYDQFIYQISTM